MCPESGPWRPPQRAVGRRPPWESISSAPAPSFAFRTSARADRSGGRFRRGRTSLLATGSTAQGSCIRRICYSPRESSMVLQVVTTSERPDIAPVVAGCLWQELWRRDAIPAPIRCKRRPSRRHRISCREHSFSSPTDRQWKPPGLRNATLIIDAISHHVSLGDAARILVASIRCSRVCDRPGGARLPNL